MHRGFPYAVAKLFVRNLPANSQDGMQTVAKSRQKRKNRQMKQIRPVQVKFRFR
jgi:hypothetical protein